MTKPVTRPHIVIPPGILGYRGVRIRRDGARSKPFYARIKINNQDIYTADFARPHEAALAYDELARKLHGDRAVLNFPPPSHSPQSVLSSENVGKSLSEEGQVLSKKHERSADESRTALALSSPQGN